MCCATILVQRVVFIQGCQVINHSSELKKNLCSKWRTLFRDKIGRFPLHLLHLLANYEPLWSEFASLACFSLCFTSSISMVYASNHPGINPALFSFYWTSCSFRSAVTCYPLSFVLSVKGMQINSSSNWLLNVAVSLCPSLPWDESLHVLQAKKHLLNIFWRTFPRCSLLVVNALSKRWLQNFTLKCNFLVDFA